MNKALRCLRILSLMSIVSVAASVWANEDETYYDEDYEGSSTYQEESYQEETYPEDSYQEETYTEDGYEEPPLQAQEPEIDSYSQELMNDARSTCQQWAQDAGLSGDEKTYFIEDCISGQTGY